MALDDDSLLRYGRQIMLPAIDIAGQEALLHARILIVGLGGLGCPVAMYLAAAGIGELVLADDDKVSLSNLQRQIAHAVTDVGRYKVDSAQDALVALNPSLKLRTVRERLVGELLAQEVALADVVVDCSDNYSTRFALNLACVQSRTPLVSGAAIRFEGQLSVFDPRDASSPCYACLMGEGTDTDLNCSENGVVAPLTGVIGSYQALETIKLVTGAGQPLVGRLLLLDALASEPRVMILRRKADCRVCSVQLADGHLDTE